MKNALVWAIGPAVASQLAALRLLPLEYSDGIVPIPNYERRANPPKLQAPFPPAEARKRVQVPPGFDIELFAAEPLITGNPVAMAWDERGRLWLAETRRLPEQHAAGRPGQRPHQDSRGHQSRWAGRQGEFFRLRLTIVTSLVFSEGGLIVAQADRLIRLKDTNGDDRADERETVMTGFGTRDTHALSSNLRNGLDNWISGTSATPVSTASSAARPTPSTRPCSFHARCEPTRAHGHVHEQHLGPGLQRDWRRLRVDGQRRAQQLRRDSAALLRWRPGLGGDGKKKIDGHYALQPNTHKIRQVDVQGGFMAAAGHSFYTARAFPQESRNRVAFVSEPTGHVLHRAEIVRDGSGYTERDGWYIAASDDEWFAPVPAEVGPAARSVRRFLRLHHPAQPDAVWPDRAGLHLPQRPRKCLRYAAPRAIAGADLPAGLDGRAASGPPVAERVGVRGSSWPRSGTTTCSAPHGATGHRRAATAPAVAPLHRRRPRCRRDLPDSGAVTPVDAPRSRRARRDATRARWRRRRAPCGIGRWCPQGRASVLPKTARSLDALLAAKRSMIQT